ncbi:MAG: hypothetical protein AB7V18_08795 [Pyrinomonadaceae bacterium]
MDGVYLHLAMNHIPVIASVFGLIILGYGVLRRSDPLTSAGLVIMVLTGLVAIPVYLTGEPAEEVAEGLPGVIESMIGAHEDLAQFALWSAIIGGVVAIASLPYRRARPEGKSGRMLVSASLAAAAITVGTMGWTAKLGGVIRHTEIRAASSQTATPASDNKRKEDDDDH